MKKKIITILAIAAMAWGVWYYMKVTAQYIGDEPVRVNISHTDTPQSARDSLVAALGSRVGNAVADMWSGNVAVTNGSYIINPDDRAWAISRKINRRQQDPIKLTFNNIRNFDNLAENISRRMDFSLPDFNEAMAEIAAQDSIPVSVLQSQFLPDTYEFFWTAQPRQVINKIRKHYLSFWNDDRLEKARRLNLTPLEVSILASIVEEESNNRAERPTIARLYLNRLQRGMPLQADPTVKFASGDFAATRITADMLAIDSPYNTYIHAGLPPGIIRLPEATTLDAVLNAPQHSYIYMCAKPDLSGSHNFTSSYSEHLANAAAFRRAAYGK